MIVAAKNHNTLPFLLLAEAWSVSLPYLLNRFFLFCFLDFNTSTPVLDLWNLSLGLGRLLCDCGFHGQLLWIRMLFYVVLERMTQCKHFLHFKQTNKWKCFIEVHLLCTPSFSIPWTLTGIMRALLFLIWSRRGEMSTVHENTHMDILWQNKAKMKGISTGQRTYWKTSDRGKQKNHSLAGPQTLVFTRWWYNWRLFLASSARTTYLEPYGDYSIDFSAKIWPQMMCNLLIRSPKVTLFEEKTSDLTNSLSTREYHS